MLPSLGGGRQHPAFGCSQHFTAQTPNSAARFETQRTALKFDCPPGHHPSEEHLPGVPQELWGDLYARHLSGPKWHQLHRALKKKSLGNSACLTPTQFPFVPIVTPSFSSPTSLHKGSVCYTTNQQSHFSVPQFQNQQQTLGDFSLLDEREMTCSYLRWIKRTQKKRITRAAITNSTFTQNPYPAHTGHTLT